MSRIGDNIKNLRESAGMSQDQLGAMIGKTRSAISQYESGKIIPRMGVIEDLAHAFSVPKYEIIGEKITYASIPLEDYDEKRILELYRSMTAEGRKRLLEQAEFLAERHTRK